MLDSCLPVFCRVLLFANKLPKSLQAQSCSSEPWAPRCACSTGHGQAPHVAPVSHKFLIPGPGTFAPQPQTAPCCASRLLIWSKRFIYFCTLCFSKEKSGITSIVFLAEKSSNTGKMRSSHRASKSQLKHCERQILSWCNSSSCNVTPHSTEPSAREYLGDWVEWSWKLQGVKTITDPTLMSLHSVLPSKIHWLHSAQGFTFLRTWYCRDKEKH